MSNKLHSWIFVCIEYLTIQYAATPSTDDMSHRIAEEPAALIGDKALILLPATAQVFRTTVGALLYGNLFSRVPRLLSLVHTQYLPSLYRQKKDLSLFFSLL